MADVVFNSAKVDLANGNIDWVNDTIKVMLVNGYTPDQDAHNFIDDVSGDEISGTGYTAGGKALANKTNTQDNTNNRAKLDADDVVWTNSTLTADGAVYYKDTGTPSTSPVLKYLDFGGAKSSTADDFTIQHHADGVLLLT